MLAVNFGTIQMQIEIAVIGRHLDDFDLLDQFLARLPVLDQVGDRADFQAVLPGEFQQLRQPRHCAVVVHDFADDADGAAAREARQIHGGLGVAGALQHAAGPGAQRKNVAGLDQILRHGGRRGHDLDGFRAVGGADAGADAARGVHAHLKIGAEALAVFPDHAPDAELFEPFARGRHANQPAAELGHEIDRGGRDELRRP